MKSSPLALHAVRTRLPLDLGEPYRLEYQFGHLLRRAYQRATANLMARIGRLGLTPMQVAVLVALWQHGKLSQGELGRAVAMDQPTVHAVVRRLQRAGRVTTERDGRDRRIRRIDLTGEGRELVDLLIPLSRESTEDTLRVYSAAERKVLIDLLRRLM